MKRLILLFVAIATLAVALSGCQKTKWKMSKQHEKYGRKALEIVDAFLDYDITIDEAISKLDDLVLTEKTLPEAKNDDEETGNTFIVYGVRNLQSGLSLAKIRKDTSNVVDLRNSIAEDLGEKKR